TGRPVISRAEYRVRRSAGQSQRQRVVEALAQHAPEHGVARVQELRVARHERGPGLAGFIEQWLVADQVGELQVREPGLPRPPQLAGPAQAQVGLGELEAVVRPRHLGEPLAGARAGERAGDEHAHRAVLAAADAAAELVELREPEALRVL